MKKVFMLIGLVILLSGCWLLDYEDPPYTFVVNNITPYTVYVWIDPETAIDFGKVRLIDYETPDSVIPPYTEKVVIRDDLEGWHLIYIENDIATSYWSDTKEFDASYQWTLTAD